MADFVSVLRRAVGNLDNNTEATRQAIYGKARTALRAQLEAIDPPLGPDEIARQIEGLDTAIAELEVEFSGAEAVAEVSEAEGSAPEDQAPVPPPTPAPGATPSDAIPPAPVQPEGPRPHESFQAAVSESGSLGTAASSAARSARETLDRIGPDDTEPVAGEDVSREHEPGRHEPDMGEPGDIYAPPPREPGAAPSAPELATAGAAAASAADTGRHVPTELYDEDDGAEKGGSGRFIAWIILLLVIVGIAGVGFWQRETVTEIVASLTSGEEAAPADDSGKIADRLPAEEEPAEQPAQAETEAPAAQPQQPQTQTSETPAPLPETGTPPASTAEGERVAQAMLIEEGAAGGASPNTLGGSVDWALAEDTEAVGGTEKVIRGTVRVPEKDIAVVVSIRRNNDEALPASHLVELVFDTGPGFENGGVANVPGLIMKATPRSTGQPLVGAVVPVMDGYFLVGLSESELDQTRNLEELKSRDFIDIPIVYKDGGRAMLSLAKGETGSRVFNEAFEDWGQ
jgi:hypothetical protein